MCVINGFDLFVSDEWGKKWFSFLTWHGMIEGDVVAYMRRFITEWVCYCLCIDQHRNEEQNRDSVVQRRLDMKADLVV